MCHHKTSAAEPCWARLPTQEGEDILPSLCPPTLYLLVPLHHTQSTFHPSIGCNVSQVIQMDPGDAYTEQIIGKSRISYFKAKLVKYSWQAEYNQIVVFRKAEKLPRDVSV